MLKVKNFKNKTPLLWAHGRMAGPWSSGVGDARGALTRFGTGAGTGRFNCQYFFQIKGTAMGKKFAPA